MALRNMMARLGAGSASVDAVLDASTTTPGGAVTGTVHLTGGKVAQQVDEIRVALEATVEVEQGDHSWREDVVFGTSAIAGASSIEPGEQRSIPFRFSVPWQCPFTSVDGWDLRGMRVGLRTRVDIPGSADPGDLDPVSVSPLPLQRTVIAALASLGFSFRSADVEKGRMRGSELPFYQEVEFRGRQIVSASEADAQALVRLLAAGGDFNQLALERSIDAATRFNGGDLGYFNPKTLPPAYGLALQTAEPGQTLGPFRTEAGWVVLRVEDRRAEAPLTLEEARPQIIRFLTYDRIRQLLEDLERRGEVEVLVEAPKGGLQEPASAPRAANPPRPS